MAMQGNSDAQLVDDRAVAAPTAAADAQAVDAKAEAQAEARLASRSESGIEVIDLWEKGRLPGKQWLFRVRDPQRESYVSKRWAKLVPGWAWAEEKKSELRLGLTSSGRAPFELVAREYREQLEERGMNARYIKEVKRLAEAVVTAGATDMRAEGFAKKVRSWIADAPSFVEGREKPGPITKNRWLVILKSIAKMGVTRFGLRTNPLTPIKPFKEDKTVKTALRVDQLRAMVADERAGHAYYRMACLLVYVGLRVEEAAHVRWDLVDLEARTITLRVIRDARGKVVWAPKGNKERVTPVLDELAELLAAMPKEERGEWVVADDAFRRMEGKGHWESFRDYLEDACDIEPGDLSPHCTRHTWTALMLATGASPNRVRRWLGHEKLSTTDIYADAEASFEKVVAGWPRAEIRLRAKPVAKPTSFVLDATQDLAGFLREHLVAGGKLEELAAVAGVPVATLRAWFVDGVPEAVRQYVAALAAHATLAATARSGSKSPATLTASHAALPAP